MRELLAAIASGLLIVTGAPPASAPSPAAAAWVTPSDAKIRGILAQRIDAEHRGVGIVVGVIDARGRRIVAYGVSDKGDPRPLNGQTMFEIGSMTKVFTSLVLSEMIESGEVKLDDPVAKFLPPGTKVPERGGRKITLIDLATHTSGLPRMPDNFRPKDPSNPYADYTIDQLYAFLGGYTLPRDIGAQYEYSNLGGGLLGQALSRRAGLDYEALVKRRITGPLGMADTTITLSPSEKARLAEGHTATLEPTANWDLPTLAGAGALRSDANDMLTFLAAELGYVKTPLAAAMQAQIEPRRPSGSPNLSVALGWHILSRPGKDEIVWHNGGTGGYRTFMGVDAKAGVGVVVLTNAATVTGGDDIGFHILAGVPLQAPQKPPSEHHAIMLDPKTLDVYVGRYQFALQAILTVTRDGDRLFTQLTGQPSVEIFPESRTDFFLKVVDAQLSFDLPPTGAAVAVTLHQNGRDQMAKRVAGP
ncbi:MAG TPA: serine hydrolase [Phenylobacterium sp.]|nr:serine hydrolase [Phenylobacterium sp.]